MRPVSQNATIPGGLAQLGERLAGSQKVIGSIPLSSTCNPVPPYRMVGPGFLLRRVCAGAG